MKWRGEVNYTFTIGLFAMAIPPINPRARPAVAERWSNEERIARLERIVAATMVCLKALWTIVSATLLAVIIRYFAAR
jgi:hypothetical protein